ncbi:WYL domain-containing protein [Idiomarina sp. Sol25]|uniref:helix-turn-helix transcriptional regulator n=1 Tax=Idiomarina sp. Sol25 TaxID=3064000 RepID=UPI00294B3445|nr:WYL domain-containing protein [Idiomarina sp. Sol25]MDV6326893.1 WYL domain-containing protein [Idiomarina sp. Sol25]
MGNAQIATNSNSPARQITQQLNDEDFGVSKRQVERDLDQLSQSFALVCNDKGKPYGWHWMEGASVDIPAISAAEALSLTMVEKVLKPLVPKSVLQSIDPRLNQAKEKLSKLQQHSDSLVQRGVSTYVVARVDPYEDVLLFAIHRMVKADLVEDKAAKPPEGFKLSTYLEQGALQFSDGKELRLRARINDNLTMHLKETPLSPDQAITTTSSTNLLVATVADSWQLRWWILSQGDQIEVAEPVELRKEIQASLKNALQNYQTYNV